MQVCQAKYAKQESVVLHEEDMGVKVKNGGDDNPAERKQSDNYMEEQKNEEQQTKNTV